MEREDTVIDLGSATAETKGPIGQGNDLVLALEQPGLTDD
ncbi:benenodin family lasso peptide [Novosphingobium sp. YAF33]